MVFVKNVIKPNSKTAEVQSSAVLLLCPKEIMIIINFENNATEQKIRVVVS